MPRIHIVNALVLAILLLLAPAAFAALPGHDELWYRVNAAAPDERAVRLHVFWSNSCPHCLEALPLLEELGRHYPWLQLRSYEVYEHTENRARFRSMAALVGAEASSVPTFMWCGEHWSGYTDRSITGRFLEQGLRDCYARVYAEAPPEPLVVAPAPDAAPDAAPETFPLPGGVDAGSLSLPTLTLVMAGLDAFNPCAFFILLVLLSLLVHARDRRLILLVGGLFVFISGLVYFLFMAAWLNAFRWIGGIQAVTYVAGAITLVLGIVNIKDYLWSGRGVSLSLSDDSRRTLFARMRPLLRGESLPALLAGTAVLAFAANSYELLCTLGFPLAYTRVLTLHDLSSAQYYGYLLFYNLVYVVPLLVIVTLFAATLGARRLGETEGRGLKLLSGMMLLGLGAVLLVAPEALSRPSTAVLLLATAGSVSAVAVWVDRTRRSRERP